MLANAIEPPTPRLASRAEGAGVREAHADRGDRSVYRLRVVRQSSDPSSRPFLPRLPRSYVHRPPRLIGGRAVMRLLGLRFIGWRRRARQTTGNAEVDVLMAGLFGAAPTTWQVQCKNTPSVPVALQDVAKEVGLIPLTRATHILMLANAPLTRDARRYADAIMQNSSVTVFLLDRTDFEAVRESPANLGRILRTQDERIRDLKMATPVWREGDARGGPDQPTLGLPLG